MKKRELVIFETPLETLLFDITEESEEVRKTFANANGSRIKEDDTLSLLLYDSEGDSTELNKRLVDSAWRFKDAPLVLEVGATLYMTGWEE